MRSERQMIVFVMNRLKEGENQKTEKGATRCLNLIAQIIIYTLLISLPKIFLLSWRQHNMASIVVLQETILCALYSYQCILFHLIKDFHTF